MKRFTEPLIGVITSFLTFEMWTNLLVSLLVAFLGGILGFLGKYVAQRWIAKRESRKIKKDESSIS